MTTPLKLAHSKGSCHVCGQTSSVRRYIGEDGPTHQPIEHLTQLQEKYGFTVENVVKLAKQQIQLNGH